MTLLLMVMLCAAPVVVVDGELIKGASLSVKELQAIGAVTIDWSDKRGAHKVTGVRLDKVLLSLGFTEGATGPRVDPKLKHQGLRGAVIATAADGFEAVFSIGELLETLGATTALIVWEMDGQPLAPNLGPFRLVVSTDKGSSRALHQLTSLRVVSLKMRR